MKNPLRQLAILVATSVFLLFATQVQAQPSASVQSDVSGTQVYVCNDPWGYWPCGTNPPFGPISYEGDYIPHVLANEWPAQAGSDALKAGAIAIRTFGWRGSPCGAVYGTTIVGGTEYRIEHNGAQVYWGCCSPQTRHYDAVNATAGLVIKNDAADYACAKYKADCGNPTADDSDEAYTLVSVPDPVDSDNGGLQLSGTSQNGTHAWELSGYNGTAPWDYRQMLTHYYAQTSMTNLAFNRWTWLDADVTGGIRYTSNYGERYMAHLPIRREQCRQAGYTRCHSTSRIPAPISGITAEHTLYAYPTTGMTVLALL